MPSKQFLFTPLRARCHSLALQRKVTCVCGLLMVAMGTDPTQAAQNGASINISVNVVANSVLRTMYQADQLQISRADIARGYVDAIAASHLSIRTNSRKGYLMKFSPLLDIFESVEVSGLTTLARLGPDGGVVVQRGAFPPQVEQDLSYRFYLSALVQAGVYPWPLQLSVAPLE